MKHFRHFALVIFFLGVTALEIGHGIFRIETIQKEHRGKVFESVERGFTELALGLRSLLSAGHEHAAYLARSPPVREVLMASPAADEARKRLEAHLLPYLVAFKGIDRVRVLDGEGRERYRCEHIGNGVGALPEALLETVPDMEIVGMAARDLTNAAVALSGLAVDRQRVEVPENERQVLHYTAGIDAGGRRLGLLVLTVYAAPLLNSVRRFSPIHGVSSFLVDADGTYLASSNRERERGNPGAGNLRQDWAGPAGEILAGKENVASPAGHFHAVAVSEAPPWRLVTMVPETALEAASAALRGEYAWIIGSMVGITLILGLTGAFFVRMSIRELQLREAQRKLEMERQLQISERLGSLGLLTAGVAHEINNPLEGIGNYIALLERHPITEEKRKRYLELIRHGFNRIRDIVRDLSSFARPDTSSGTADLARVVTQAMKLLAYSKEFKAVEVELRGLDSPLPVPGDAGRLEQVLINLLHNSGRAMHGDGKIVVRAGRLPAAKEDDSQVELVVEDTGPGIPEEILGKIFDPFFTTTDGTGLGLSISYGIVRAHGGSLSARNRAGGGASFTIRLPAARPAETVVRQERTAS